MLRVAGSCLADPRFHVRHRLSLAVCNRPIILVVVTLLIHDNPTFTHSVLSSSTSFFLSSLHAFQMIVTLIWPFVSSFRDILILTNSSNRSPSESEDEAALEDQAPKSHQ